MWKHTLYVAAGLLGIPVLAVGIVSLVPAPGKAQANRPEMMTFVGKIPIDGTYEHLHHYQSKNGTNCFVLVTERGAKTAQHISCVRN